MVVALVALIAATAARPSRCRESSSIDRNDLKKNSVRSKAIKNGQVEGSRHRA